MKIQITMIDEDRINFDTKLEIAYFNKKINSSPFFRYIDILD